MEAVPTPRGSSECRLNAERGRQQSDWFSHESTSAAGGASSLRPSSARGARPASPTHAAGISSLERGTAPTPRRTYFKSGEDPQKWFKYGADFKDQIIGRACQSHYARGTLGEGSDVKKKMTDCQSNSWFRHEHAPGENGHASVDHSMKKHPKSIRAMESANSPLNVRAEGEEVAAKPTRRPETAEYMRRHKADKSSEWFTHERSSEASASEVSPQYKGSKECARNAEKFKGESSKAWFSHNPEEKYVEPRPQPKLTSAEARQLMERSKGDEMKQVFRMDQNLKVTWSAPGDQPRAEEEKPTGEGSQTLVEKFLNSNKSSQVNGCHDSKVLTEPSVAATGSTG